MLTPSLSRLQARRAWIEIRCARCEATRRTYRREAELWLPWTIVAKRKPLSSLNTLDAAEYLKQFLADPQPAVRWIGRNQIERFPRPGGRSSASSRRVAATRREARGCLACFGLSTSSWHGLPVQSDTSCRIPLRSSRTISWLRLNFEIMRGIEYQI